MNEEIRKFWENAGYTLRDTIGPTWILCWARREHLEWHIATFRCDLPKIIYYFNYNEYTEEEMLRIVMLKAFC